MYKCTMVIVIFLFLILLIEVIFRTKRQKLDFLSFAYHSSLLGMQRCCEERYKDTVEERLILDLTHLDITLLVLKPRNFLLLKVFLFLQLLFIFLIYSIKVNPACCWKSWFCSLNVYTTKLRLVSIFPMIIDTDVERSITFSNVLKLAYTALE